MTDIEADLLIANARIKILEKELEERTVVVKCKDCNNCTTHRKKNGEVYFYKCEFHDIEIEPDDFCSYGERGE